LPIPFLWPFWVRLIVIGRGMWTEPMAAPSLDWSALGGISPEVASAAVERVTAKRARLAAVLCDIRLKEWGSPWTLASPFLMFGMSI
jgi:hypothetical protein